MNLFPDKEKPLLLTVDLKENVMMLNEGILEALKYPAQVQILHNDATRRIAIRRCALDDSQAIAILGKRQAEIKERNIVNLIRKIAGWEQDSPRICIGEADPNNPAVFFDLTKVITVETVGGSKKGES